MSALAASKTEILCSQRTINLFSFLIQEDIVVVFPLQ